MKKVGFALLNGLLVFIGGGLGALCRFEIGHLLPRVITNQPIFNATLIVNMSACLLAGIITGALYDRVSRRLELLRAFTMFGFFGGFSTLAALEILGNWTTESIFALLLNIIGGVILAVVGLHFVLKKRGVEW